MTQPTPLTVAVTGPTGTFGFGLLPLLEDEPGIAAVVGVARRPFDPAAHGWSKLTYRQGDVRDPDALREAFAGADVVVHLAFLITGSASADTIRAINVDGTLNAFRAAADAGAARFVYTSSVAAYGFHSDTPVPVDETWPTRAADHLFYAQEKAELEELLAAESARHPDLDLYVLRPPIVLGPHAVGAKSSLVERLLPVGLRAARVLRDLPVPIPALAPGVRLQFIHEHDVGRALVACIQGAGPPGAYNIAGRGVVTGADVLREVGLAPLTVPPGLVATAARAVASVPLPPVVPPVAGWVEALTYPPVMATLKAQRELGWQPRYSSLEALRATLAAS